MKNFLRLYAESEELLYKMCNDKYNPIRKNAINKNLKGISLISSIWRNGMASPSGKRILNHIQKGTLKVSYKNFGNLRMIASKFKLDERRYHGLNLTNIGNKNKNTIEFRMSNGTLDSEVIKQNVYLYASLINIAIQITENPSRYEEELKEFYKTNVTEKQKVRNFLNLIMQDEEDKKIYMERWESVKDDKVYEKNYKKGFAQKRFTREQLKKIEERTDKVLIKQAYEYIRQILEKTTNIGEVENDR